jgi:exopolyphosphatase / guanosine-5'-triphosphate,3'-diphosphate pyrophosphatase
VIVAAIDIGTNSVLLLIAETTPGGLSPLVERATITRLGEGVDRTRELTRAARERTLACLADYASDLARHAPVRIAAVGTSAMRDARGGPEFAKEAQQVLGTLPLVIGGEREAELTFRGALSGLGLETGRRAAVLDVGGGSTEIVVGSVPLPSGQASIESATSLDLGSVRLFERHVASDPPSPSELDAARRDVDRVLSPERSVPSEAVFVGVAGTVTTLAAIAGEIDPYDATRIHGKRLAIDTVRHLAARLASLSLSDRKKLRGLDERRADVIVTGALLVERVLTWSQKPELLVSDRGVRWGLAEELVVAS